MATATRRAIGFLAASLGFLLHAGCTFRQADLTAVSTRNVNLEHVDLDRLDGTLVTGVSKGFIFLGLIPISWPHLEEAVNDALTQGRGDLITDAVVYQSSTWVVLATIPEMTIKGTVVDTKSVPMTEKR